MNVDQLVLEFATDRAGEIIEFGGKELGLGVVNPRTDRVEPPEEIQALVERALAIYPIEKLFLNPDCGFGTFSNRPLNSARVACDKLKSIVAAARTLREAAGG